MTTLPITNDDMMIIISSNFCNCPEVWDEEKKDLFFCFLKHNFGYRDYVTYNIDKLEQDEDKAVAMFVDAWSVLFADPNEEKKPSINAIMSCITKMMALYIYCSPENGVTYAHKDADGMLTFSVNNTTPCADIIAKEITKEDIKNEAIRMTATFNGIRSAETINSVRIGLAKLLMLIWNTKKEDLLETQKLVHSAVEKLVNSRFTNVE